MFKPSSDKPWPTLPNGSFDLQTAFKEAKTRFDFGAAFFMILFHIGAFAALFFFSWTNLLAAIAMYLITGLGITVGYHRLLAHRAFKTPKWLERIWATFGCLALQRDPTTWVAIHRQHHSESDSDLDPHNIRRGFGWAHFGWVFEHFPDWYENGQRAKFAPDMLKDPYYRWLINYHWVLQALLGAILLAVGGFGMFLWGICLRLVCVYHFTWFVNSACHYWGYRHFEHEQATNNWVVAMVSFGEGWHNNHHALPSSARQGLRFWEVDIAWMTIWTMSKFGLASKIIKPRREELPWIKKKLQKESLSASAQ